MKINKLTLLTFAFLATFIVSCGDEAGPTEMFTDNFDRAEMLTDWSDLIIIPAFEAYAGSLQHLVESKNVFLEESNISNFENLKLAYLDAYKSWQSVAMFDIGRAEQISLRNFTNIYPTDTELITEYIDSQEYDLRLPSNFDVQGFPALDYLLFGLAEDREGILAFLIQDNYAHYLDDLINRLNSLALEVLNDWKNGYRESFINNSGSSATASVDKLVNDYLFYYEKYLRAGKVGIPAGIFSGQEIETAVEAPYSNVYSKELFFEAFTSVQDFFEGRSFDGLSKGQSLTDYLAYIMEQNQTDDIAKNIQDQWGLADTKAQDLSDSFKEQVINDNIKMLETYDELQKAVVFLKVDMMQALNIQVDYVDADGD